MPAINLSTYCIYQVSTEYILYISGEYIPVKVVPQPGSSAGLITQLERLFLEEC